MVQPWLEPFFGTELEALLEEAAENGCPGFDPQGKPMADPGTLCVYGYWLSPSSLHPGGTGVPRTKLPDVPNGDQIYLNGGRTAKPEENGEPAGSGYVEGAGPSGTALTFNCSGSCEAYGSWAVTAE
jgi:hypothetical protein